MVPCMRFSNTMTPSRVSLILLMTIMANSCLAEKKSVQPLRRKETIAGSYGVDPDYASTAAPTHEDVTPKNNWSAPAGSGIDFLVAAFFLIAAGWLVLALVYALMVYLIVRMRSRGQLDVYDENFGRIYLIGRRCYIPLGFILRRYVVAMEHDENSEGNPGTVRLMTREERRTAMELLLTTENTNSEDKEDTPNELSFATTDITDECMDSEMDPSFPVMDLEDQEIPEERLGGASGTLSEQDGQSAHGSTAEPVCSICLAEYDGTDPCYNSTTCPHRFHRDCILDWLERRAITECPCCREPMVADDDVWETVQQIRRERRKQLRREGRGGIFSRVVRFFRRTEERNADPQEAEHRMEMATH